MINSYEYEGISYKKPSINLIADNGIGHSEFAGRTCYDSYNNSENTEIRESYDLINSTGQCGWSETRDKGISRELEMVKSSNLLKQLSFVHFHHSVLEHSVLTFYITNVSRSLLQELVRHRIASYSVQSTRYTIDLILYYYLIAHTKNVTCKYSYFLEHLLELDLFTTSTPSIIEIEIKSIYDKLNIQMDIIGIDRFKELVIPKSIIELFDAETNASDSLEILMMKKKRNAGDAFKSILVSEMFNVSLVMTINLRSMKNFFDLRLNGAAWFQIRELAGAMKEVLPSKYLDLICKKEKPNE